MLWHKPEPYEDPELGQFSRRGNPQNRWASDGIATAVGSVVIDLAGEHDRSGRPCFGACQANAPARRLDSRGAVLHLDADAAARKYIDGQGTLVPDGFSFSDTDDRLEVELSLSHWPDAMISAVLQGGSPCGVMLAD